MSKARAMNAPRPDGQNKEIGDFFLALRTVKGMTQRQFAEVLETHGPHLNHVEHGRVRYPYELIKRLPKEQRAAALEILVQYQREDVGL